ncbi:MAG: hypothetical protein HY720_04630 [Planctomycetes bacterium]|nr:hypothetical protein [Planctomycetota bacterium]
MSPRPITAALAAALALAAAPPTAADRITLLNGEVLRGRVVERTDETLVVRLPFLTVTLDPANVKEIAPEPAEVYVRETAEELLRLRDDAKAHEFLAENVPGTADTPELRRMAKVAEGLAVGREKIESMDFDEASASIASAQEVAPDHEGLAALGKELAETKAFVAEKSYMPGPDRRLETRRFEIVHRNPKLAASLGPLLEKLLDEAAREIRAGENHRLELKGRIEFVLFPTPELYREAIGERGAARPGTVLGPFKVATHQGAPEESLRPLLSRLATRHLYPILPAWAEEGIAGGALAARPADLYDPLRAAYREGHAFTLSEMLLLRDPGELPAERADLFALQSRALADFLVHNKGNKLRFRQMLQDAEATVARRIAELMKEKDPKPVEGGYSMRNLVREEVVKGLAKHYRYDDLSKLQTDLREFLKVE